MEVKFSLSQSLPQQQIFVSAKSKLWFNPHAGEYFNGT